MFSLLSTDRYSPAERVRICTCIRSTAQSITLGETAWAFRDATWSMVIAGISPDPAEARAITAWAKEYWEAVHPYTMGGAYINFVMEEGTDRIKATYRDNYDRLTEVKRKYNPSNFFHVNQNIKPQ
jgi:Berberine and berberine like